MNEPSVSVIIPAYNCGAFIRRALDSVLAQSDETVEVIVVDDGSTDDTPSILGAYNSRIRLIQQSNQGVAMARNRGIAVARGRWLAFLDADDVWHANKIKNQLRAESQFPDAGLIFTDFRLVDEEECCLVDAAAKSYYGVFRRHDLEWSDIFGQMVTTSDDAVMYYGNCFKSLFLGNFIKTSTVMIRHDCIQNTGAFDASLTTEEDYDLWLKVSLEQPMAYLNMPLVDVRRRPGQLTSLGNAALVAENSARVVTRIADVAGKRLGESVVRQRLSVIYRHLARVRLLAGNHALARQAAQQSLEFKNMDLALFGIMVWSYFPEVLTRWLADGFRATRRLVSMAHGGS